MDQIFDVEEALRLLFDNQILIAIDHNYKNYYHYKNGNIVIVNENLTAVVHEDDFRNDFKNFKFFLFEKEDEEYYSWKK